MTVVVDFIALVIVARGIVHQHDIVAREIVGDIGFEKRPRRVFARIDRTPLGIAPRPREAHGRLAQIEHEHPVDHPQHLRLAAFEFGLLRTVAGGFTQRKPVFAQFEFQQGGHLGGMLAAVRFGHHLLRHQPVLAHDIRNPGKLAAVAERVLEQPLDRPILARCVAGVDNPLQEEVRLLQLIPEKTVVLRKLEGPQPVARNHAGAQHVQT